MYYIQIQVHSSTCTFKVNSEVSNEHDTLFRDRFRVFPSLQVGQNVPKPQQFQMNRQISQFLEFYRRKEKPLESDSNHFCNFFYLHQVSLSIYFQVGHTNATLKDVNSLEGQKKAQIRQNLTLLRRECVITHIPLQMNRQIVHFAANSIDSFGEECVR